jgi:glycogen debranching enzyme
MHNQDDNGFIGNIVYWKHIFPARFTDFFQMKFKSIFKIRAPHMSRIVQPPMLAQTVWKIYEKTKDLDFVREMLPKLKKYYNWLADNRDFDGDNLLNIITTFESGMDWKPTFDPVVNFKRRKANWKLFFKVVSIDFKNFIMNYDMKKLAKSNHFRVKDAGFNSIYARNLQDLAELCRLVDDEDGAELYLNRKELVSNAMMDIMYDDEDAAFYDVYGKDDKKLKILTPTIFYPLLIDSISKKVGQKVMDRHFYESEEFDTPFPIPSLAKNDPAFDPRESLYLWRGPTWIIHNWFMHKHLIFKEHHEKAETLMKSMMNLIEKSGFREYYNPFTGEGYGAHDFTWAGLILDMMEDRKK